MKKNQTLNKRILSLFMIPLFMMSSVITAAEKSVAPITPADDAAAFTPPTTETEKKDPSTSSSLSQTLKNAQVPLNQIAAVVNDDVITTNELDERVTQFRSQLMAAKQPFPSAKILRETVLQNLINVKLQLQLAHRLGIEINPAEVDQTIAEIADRNHMTQAMLQEQLKKEGMSYDDYRENIQHELTIHKLQRDAVAREIHISEKQIDRYVKHHPEVFNADRLFTVRDIVISGADKLDDPRVTEVTQLLQAHKSLEPLTKSKSSITVNELGSRKYSELPSLFLAKIKTMKKGDISGPIQAPNGIHILELLDAQGETAKKTIVQTHVRHILVKADNLKTKDEIKHEADELYKQIAGGAKFDEVAQNYSDDLGTAYKGGDLGWVKSEVLVPEFVTAMNELKPGETSQPVHSPFGYHIIQVLGRRHIDDTEADLRQKAQMILYRQRFEAQLQNWLVQLHGQAYIKIMNADKG